MALQHVEVVTDTDGSIWVGWRITRALGDDFGKIKFLKLQKPAHQGEETR